MPAVKSFPTLLPVQSPTPRFLLCPRIRTRSLASVLLFLVAAGAALPPAVPASTLTVPDDVPTIQGALDARVDTVLVRSGSYPETPVVSRPVYLAGILGDVGVPQPLLDGLSLLIGPAAVQQRFTITHLDFAGPVYLRNDDDPSLITFRYCDMRSGIIDLSEWIITSAISLHACSISGGAQLFVDGTLSLDSCTVEGALEASYGGARLLVSNSRFVGTGTGIGIFAYSAGSVTIVGNTIDNYYNGIVVFPNFGGQVVGNAVSDCLGKGIDVSGDPMLISGNDVQRCGEGIVASATDLDLLDNRVAGSRWLGIYAGLRRGSVLRNVVWGSGLDGIRVGGDYAQARISSNTSCLNGGSGIASSFAVTEWDYCEFVGNIGYGNGEYGIRWISPDATVVRCNDWFGNALGAVEGRPPSTEDFSVDPQFCDPQSGDFRLQAGSELLDWPGCGLVGALGYGCGATATRVARFTAERATEGIRVVWELGEGATAWEVWLERSEGSDGEPWIRPMTERSWEGRAVVELDRGAVAERAYWYRLVAREGEATAVIGPPIAVEAQVAVEFGLVQVGPSPGSGPLRIEFALAHAAAVEIDVFDVQGRMVGSPGRGVWPAGKHAVEWSGHTGSAPAPAGVYVVRYRYPGGEATRRFVRSR